MRFEPAEKLVLAGGRTAWGGEGSECAITREKVDLRRISRPFGGPSGSAVFNFVCLPIVRPRRCFVPRHAIVARF